MLWLRMRRLAPLTEQFTQPLVVPGLRLLVVSIAGVVLPRSNMGPSGSVRLTVSVFPLLGFVTAMVYSAAWPCSHVVWSGSLLIALSVLVTVADRPMLIVLD